MRGALLRWYDANRRDLPWRRTDDPYAIWISETMLQQTRVETVIPYYERFLERFPDVASLASADRDDVYGHWAGLGYYSRARNLKAAAVKIVEEYGGQLPDDVEELRTLPGVGRYTAGAVASIAFDRRAPIVDGNVVRVLARLRGIREDVRSRNVVDALWEEAARLADGPRPGDLNQALMELGATVCTPRSPDCPACPLARHCDARAAGDAEALPVKPRKPKARRFEAVAAWIERRGRVLAVRRPQEGLLGGLWELPGGPLERGEAPEEGLHRQLGEALGLSVESADRVGSVEHLFTHRRLELHVFRCGGVSGRVRRSGFDAHRWLAPGSLGGLGHGAPTRKALALLGRGDGVSPREAGRG
ncbi:MAG: A/G-specific adenine glycosylase [Myxococcota bacterium]